MSARSLTHSLLGNYVGKLLLAEESSPIFLLRSSPENEAWKNHLSLTDERVTLNFHSEGAGEEVSRESV